jgi:hypothetical protein
MELFVPASVGTHEFRSREGLVMFKSLPARITGKEPVQGA